MSQTNVQVPIEQRNHEKEVLEKRKILLGDERFRSPGPSSLGQDDIPMPLQVYHTSVSGGPRADGDAPDMLYGERMGGTNPGGTGEMPMMTHTRKQYMSGRRHTDQSHDLNQGLNVGSTHLELPAEPHGPTHRKAPVSEGGITLPKDQ